MSTGTVLVDNSLPTCQKTRGRSPCPATAYRFSYDGNGNISAISDGTNTTSYEYDSLGQLTKESNQSAGKVWEYSYDSCGNILSKTEYDYSENNGTWVQATAGTAVNYSYNDSTWGDLLTAYNGQSITYDTMGNPLSYRGMNFTWQGGRQLAGVTKDGTATSYTYNENGLRTSKTTGTETTSYYYSGDVLTGLETSNYSLYFHYDENGGIIGYTKHTAGTDTEYFYVKNLQGDILQVIDATGISVAQYSYDAWGNILTAAGTEAAINPIRYRGYYFDTETGLYYVSSRYYDSEVDRFISPDTTDVLTATLDHLADKNLFAYCGNNPVIRADQGGQLSSIVIGATVGALVGVIGQVVSDAVTSFANGELTLSNWQTYTGAFIGGAAAGAILGGTGNVALANAASGSVTTGVGLFLEKKTGVSDKSWGEIALNSVADGAISYGLGNLPGIKGITKGRNSMTAVYKSGLKKLLNGTAKTMSIKVIGKGVVSSFFGGLAMDGYYGLKQYGYEYFRRIVGGVVE